MMPIDRDIATSLPKTRRRLGLLRLAADPVLEGVEHGLTIRVVELELVRELAQRIGDLGQNGAKETPPKRGAGCQLRFVSVCSVEPSSLV